MDFAKNPAGPTSFKSINGELRVSFQPGLSADVRLKTFNGEAWTDFDGTTLPTEGGHWTGKLYSRDRSTGIRIGSGGPAINFDALNGNIYILNRGKEIMKSKVFVIAAAFAVLVCAQDGIRIPFSDPSRPGRVVVHTLNGNVSVKPGPPGSIGVETKEMLPS